MAAAGGPRRRRSGLVPVLAVALAVMGLYALGSGLGLIRLLEWQSLTWRFQLRGPIEPGPEVTVVEIDNASVAALGQWPPSREHLARAVRAVAADGARVIAFDLLLTERQPVVSAEVASVLWAARGALPEDEAGWLVERIDDLLRAGGPDIAFAEAMERAGNVILPYAFVFDPAESNREALTGPVEGSAYRLYRLASGDRPALLTRPAGLLAPPPRLAAAAPAMAHVTIVLDPDGVLRHEYPVIGYRGRFFPSLPIEALRQYWGVSRDDVAVRFGEGIAMGGRTIATDRHMRLAVNHYGPRSTFDSHAFRDLIEGEVPAGTFAGRIVLIGSTALGVGNSFASPFARTLSGTEYYATVIDNLLHDRALQRRPWTRAIDLGAIAVCAVAGLFAGRLRGLVWPGLALGAVLAAVSLGVLAAFSVWHLWLSYIFPLMAAVLAFGWSAAERAVVTQRQRLRAERQRENLARYLPPSMVEELASRDSPFAADRTQHAAVVFIDIIGFTSLSERLSPADAMALLREFLALVERHVFAHDGMLDKFLGDGALAVFGVTGGEVGRARGALACARDLVGAVEEWSARRTAAGQPPVRIGIGVHYGLVLIGDIGGDRQVQFTVVGDTVNVASRLSHLTRTLSAAVVVSDPAMEAARAAGGAGETADFVPLPEQAIRGRNRSLGVWVWSPAAPPAAEDAARSDDPERHLLARDLRGE
jgi:adenylate cyclase